MRDILNLDGASLNSKGEKALLPVHFLSCVSGMQGVMRLTIKGRI